MRLLGIGRGRHETGHNHRRSQETAIECHCLLPQHEQQPWQQPQHDFGAASLLPQQHVLQPSQLVQQPVRERLTDGADVPMALTTNTANAVMRIFLNIVVSNLVVDSMTKLVRISRLEAHDRKQETMVAPVEQVLISQAEQSALEQGSGSNVSVAREKPPARSRTTSSQSAA